MKKLMQFVLLSAMFLAVSARKVEALSYNRSVTANFSVAVGTGNALVLRNDQQFFYQVLSGNNPNVGTVRLEKSCDGSNFGVFSTAISTSNNSFAGVFSSTIAVENCAGGKVWVRFQQTAYTSGASSTTIREIDSVAQSLYNFQNESVVDVYQGGFQSNGYNRLFPRTRAQLQALAPSSGDQYYCSDCSPKKVVVATGTAVSNFSDAAGGEFK